MSKKSFINITEGNRHRVIEYLMEQVGTLNNYWTSRIKEDTPFTIFYDRHNTLTWAELKAPSNYTRDGVDYIYVKIDNKIYLGGE